ncbi:hypothetical protein AM228_17385 [Planktothricoides sp. SR001]|nr:hypothetical protein AM228_17385 [Planktothricoides sp. SR001]
MQISRKEPRFLELFDFQIAIAFSFSQARNRVSFLDSTDADIPKRNPVSPIKSPRGSPSPGLPEVSFETS